MKNPFSVTKQTRKTYNKQLERVVTEVEIDIEGAPKTWMPLETLIALLNFKENEPHQIQSSL
jgi:hypothetical protein